MDAKLSNVNDSDYTLHILIWMMSPYLNLKYQRQKHKYPYIWILYMWYTLKHDFSQLFIVLNYHCCTTCNHYMYVIKCFTKISNTHVDPHICTLSNPPKSRIGKSERTRKEQWPIYLNTSRFTSAILYLIYRCRASVSPLKLTAMHRMAHFSSILLEKDLKTISLQSMTVFHQICNLRRFVIFGI